MISSPLKWLCFEIGSYRSTDQSLEFCKRIPSGRSCQPAVVAATDACHQALLNFLMQASKRKLTSEIFQVRALSKKLAAELAAEQVDGWETVEYVRLVCVCVSHVAAFIACILP